LWIGLQCNLLIIKTAVSLKQIDLIIQHNANATGTHQPKLRAIADKDVPANYCHPHKGRGDLRPGALPQHMAGGRASGIQRLQRAKGDFLSSFRQKLADKTDATKGDGEGTGGDV
jgi:hypothetical protein